MPRRPSSRLVRSQKVRTDGADLLVEGYGEDYGWVSSFAWQGGTLGDYDPGGDRPSWWVGSDEFDGSPIGPHGPGDGFGYGWDPRARLPHGGWWNRPHAGSGLIAAVTRCTEVIAQPVVRTAWVVDTPKGPIPTPLWLRDPMLAGTVPGETVPLFGAGQRLTGHAFWSSVFVHALWWGRGGFMFMEGADGQPLPGSFLQVNPFMVGRHEGRWVIDPHGEDPVVTDFDGRFEVAGKPWRIVVMRGMAPHDDHTPSGVLTRHFDTLRLGAAVSKYVQSTFASGVPSGYLKVSQPQFTQDDAKALKAAWMSAHGSGKRSVAVLNSTVDYQPVSITPVDADADKMSRLSRIDVAHAFGLSAAWLDTGDGSLTYANMVDRRRDLVDTTLAGWGQSLMECLSALLPYGTDVRINWATFTAPDMTSQIPVLVQAVQAGFMSPAEARALIGLDPIEAASEGSLSGLEDPNA